MASSPALRSFPALIAGQFPRVFVYHRFVPGKEIHPHRVSAEEFSWQLKRIARQYRVLSLNACLEHYQQKGSWPEKSVVITVDDGYHDFYQWAYPELRRLSLPATFFVTVNFVDKKKMLWPDRLHWAIENTDKKILHFNLEKRKFKFFLRDDKEKFAAWKNLSDFCVESHDHVKWDLINSVEMKLGVSPPDEAPADYAPVTWDQLLEMSNNGIEIGCHTLNHPVLSRIPSDQLHDEIVVSKQILEKKLNKPVHTICYPNSRPGDINDQVVSVVKKAGYKGAPFGSDLTSWEPFMIPRMGASSDRTDFESKLNGLEYVGQLMRKKMPGKNN